MNSQAVLTGTVRSLTPHARAPFATELWAWEPTTIWGIAMSSLFCEMDDRHVSHRNFIAQIAKNMASELPDVAVPTAPTAPPCVSTFHSSARMERQRSDILVLVRWYFQLSSWGGRLSDGAIFVLARRILS